MAKWHIDELRAALEHNGWHLVSELDGDDLRVSASWLLSRGGGPSQTILDFDGLDDLKVLPLHESYSCTLRKTNHSLYFYRRGINGSEQRAKWKRELLDFVKGIEATSAV